MSVPTAAGAPCERVSEAANNFRGEETVRIPVKEQQVCGLQNLSCPFITVFN